MNNVLLKTMGVLQIELKEAKSLEAKDFGGKINALQIFYFRFIDFLVFVGILNRNFRSVCEIFNPFKSRR